MSLRTGSQRELEDEQKEKSPAASKQVMINNKNQLTILKNNISLEMEASDGTRGEVYWF